MTGNRNRPPRTLFLDRSSRVVLEAPAEIAHLERVPDVDRDEIVGQALEIETDVHAEDLADRRGELADILLNVVAGAVAGHAHRAPPPARAATARSARRARINLMIVI